MSGRLFPFPPVLYNYPFHPGQLGVPGSADFNLERVGETEAKALYVDASHTAANDNNDGLNPDRPLKTIQAAVNKVTARGDIIYVAPAFYTEAVVTPNDTTGPEDVAIVGTGPTDVFPVWLPVVATSPCLFVRAAGWKVSNFLFSVPRSQAAIVLATGAVGISSADDDASGAIVQHCIFDGSSTLAGSIGIDLLGAPEGVRIEDNYFSCIGGTTGTAIACTAITALGKEPASPIIKDNVFVNGTVFIDIPAKDAIITGNVLMMSANGISPTTYIDLRGYTNDKTCTYSGGGVIYMNVFDGTYSNAGGYYANTTHSNFWSGNLIRPAVAAATTQPWTSIPPA